MLTPAEREFIRYLAARAVARHRRDREKQQEPPAVRPATQPKQLEPRREPGQ